MLSPWRVTGLALIAAHWLVALSNAAWAQNPNPEGTSPTPARIVVQVGVPAPVTAPAATGLQFSPAPTSDEILQSGVFAEPLVPAGEVAPEENAALASALLGHANTRITEQYYARHTDERLQELHDQFAPDPDI